jgi:hypothetical protein
MINIINKNQWYQLIYPTLQTGSFAKIAHWAIFIRSARYEVWGNLSRTLEGGFTPNPQGRLKIGITILARGQTENSLPRFIGGANCSMFGSAIKALRSGRPNRRQLSFSAPFSLVHFFWTSKRNERINQLRIRMLFPGSKYFFYHKNTLVTTFHPP